MRALISAGLPSVREPTGCNRADGKRPDGMTLVPWKRGKALIWDFTCSDTLAPSNILPSSKRAGAVAARREAEKKNKYINLIDRFHFVPIAIESCGSWGCEGLNFIKELGQRLSQFSGDTRASSFLIQRISVAIQRGNVASMLGTLPPGKELEEVILL